MTYLDQRLTRLERAAARRLAAPDVDPLTLPDAELESFLRRECARNGIDLPAGELSDELLATLAAS